MAARLTIDSIYQKRFQQFMPAVNEWAARRDMLIKEGFLKAAQAAQECVEYYYHKLHERGYFGDNYRHNLLDRFGLCWTNNIYFGLLSERDEITPNDARTFLQLLHDRQPLFERNLRTAICVSGMTRAETTHYYRNKYARLKVLLSEGMTRNEPIAFSR